MNHCIVYSMYINEDESINESLHFHEFIYSLKTLRQYSDIDVKLYISPSNILNEIKINFNDDKLEIIPFDVSPNSKIENKTYANWLDHKWKTAFLTLEKFKYDSVLMIDADTIYNRSPDYLFKKYSDPNKLYAKPDIWDDFLREIEVEDLSMNDGVVIISKKMLKYKDIFLYVRDKHMLDLAEKYRHKIDNRHAFWLWGIWWAAAQYGIYEFLKAIGNKPIYIDDDDVNYFGNSTIVHYLHTGAKQALPAEYWPNKDNTINPMDKHFII